MQSVTENESEGQPSPSPYEIDYIRRALTSDVLEAPDKPKATKYFESLISLYNAHRLGGKEAVQRAWVGIKKMQPELGEYDPEAPTAFVKPDDDQIALELAPDIRGEVRYFHSQWKVYRDGCWRGQDGYEFRHYIRGKLRRFRPRGVTVSQTRIKQVVSMLEDDLFIPDKDVLELQAQQAKYINLRNGVFNLDTMEFEPRHRPELYFTTQLNFDYDPDAKASFFWRYLQTSLVKSDDKTEPDGSLIDLLLEVLGYCFTARTDLKASFWLYGGKDTGKSTFVTLLKSLMGDLYTTIDLTQLGTNRFLLASMVGKRVIGFAEGESNTVLPDALYKTLTGGSDEIFADVKNRDPITFRMEAKIVWAMNNLPRISDRTGATTRRVFIIPYNRSIPESERIADLEAKLMLERPGIFNLAMDALKELTGRGSFVKCLQSERIKHEYIYQNDTEATFIAECCEQRQDYLIKSGELYDTYKFWCERFGFHAKNANQVAQEWKRLGFEWKHSNGSWWVGLRLKPTQSVENLPLK